MIESLSRTLTPTAYLTLESDVPAEAELVIYLVVFGGWGLGTKTHNAQVSTSQGSVRPATL